MPKINANGSNLGLVVQKSMVRDSSELADVLVVHNPASGSAVELNRTLADMLHEKDVNVASIDTRVASADTRFGSGDTRFGSADTRLTSADTRMTSGDTRFGS